MPASEWQKGAIWLAKRFFLSRPASSSCFSSRLGTSSLVLSQVKRQRWKKKKNQNKRRSCCWWNMKAAQRSWCGLCVRVCLCLWVCECECVSPCTLPSRIDLYLSGRLTHTKGNNSPLPPAEHGHSDNTKARRGWLFPRLCLPSTPLLPPFTSSFSSLLFLLRWPSIQPYFSLQKVKKNQCKRLNMTVYPTPP